MERASSIGDQLYPSQNYTHIDTALMRIPRKPRDWRQVIYIYIVLIFWTSVHKCDKMSAIGARAPPALGAAPTAHIHFIIGSVYCSILLQAPLPRHLEPPKSPRVYCDQNCFNCRTTNLKLELDQIRTGKNWGGPYIYIPVSYPSVSTPHTLR